METQSQEIGALMEALSKAQAVIRSAEKDSSNPFYKSQYADLQSVWKACREALTSNGLAVSQVITNEGPMMSLITILGHSSGQWIKGSVPLNTDKLDPQTVGKLITYFRRYCLSAIVGVAPGDDDDAEGAMTQHRGQDDRQKLVDAFYGALNGHVPMATDADIDLIVEYVDGLVVATKKTKEEIYNSVVKDNKNVESFAKAMAKWKSNKS